MISVSQNPLLADSYLSLVELTAINGGTGISGLTDPQIEQILIHSSFIINSSYRYLGKKTDDSQLLEFPRDDLDLPYAIKKCTALLVTSLSSSYKGNVKQFRSSDMNETYFRETEMPPQCSLLLRPFITISVPLRA